MAFYPSINMASVGTTKDLDIWPGWDGLIFVGVISGMHCSLIQKHYKLRKLRIRVGAHCFGALKWGLEQTPNMTSVRVRSSDSHSNLYVVSPWCNRLGSVLFGPLKTGMPLHWTTYRGLSYKKRRFKRPKVWDVWNVNSEFGMFHIQTLKMTKTLERTFL